MEAPTPAQILTLAGGDQGQPCWVKMDNLDVIVAKFNRSDRRIHVITACGPGRYGRSFMLNILEQSIKASAAGIQGVLGAGCYVPNRPLKGFHWAYGDERVTHGLWITDRPITLQDETTGEDVDVYLIDTQSVCDEFSKPEETQAMLRLCLQISTILLFCVPHQLSPATLSEIAQAVRDSDETTTPCKRLHFVIRDFSPHPHFPYDEDGGQEYLKKRLQRFTDIRDALNQSFQEISCTLVPAPGSNVFLRDYEGDLARINHEFIEAVEELEMRLVTTMKQNVPVNDINDNITHFTTNKFVQQLARSTGINVEFENRAVENPIGNHNHHSSEEHRGNPEQLLKSKCEQCLEEYNKTVETVIENTRHKYLEKEDFQTLHQRAETTALNALKSSDIQATLVLHQKYTAELQAKLGHRYSELEKQNRIRREELHRRWMSFVNKCVNLYRLQVEELFGDDAKKMLRPTKIQIETSTIEASVQNHLMTLVDKDDPNLVSEYTQKLKEKCKQIFATEKRGYEERRRDWLEKKYEQCRADAEGVYKRRMKHLMSPMAPGAAEAEASWPEDQLEEFHRTTKRQVLAEADLPDDTDAENLGENLRTFLDGQFWVICQENQLKRKEFLVGKDKILNPLLTDYEKQIQKLVIKDGQTAKALQRSCGELQADVQASFTRNTTIKDPIVIQELMQELQTRLEAISLGGAQNFAARLKSEEELGTKLIAAAVGEYKLKMETFSESKQLLDDEDLDSFHATALTETMTVFADTCRQKLVGGDRRDEYGKRLVAKINALLPALKQEASEYMKKRLQDAEQLLKETADAYQNDLRPYKQSCTSLAQLQSYHDSKSVDIIREFQDKWTITDKKYLSPMVDRLLAMLGTLFQPVRDELFVRIEKEKILIAERRAEAAKLYKKEMKTHFDKTKFIKPSDFRLKHEEIARPILQELSKGLSENGISCLREALLQLYDTYNEQNTMNTPGTGGEVAIGIDLGTTHSCVAIYHNGSVEVIDSEVGAKTVPSHVVITPDGIVVGETAKSQAKNYPFHSIFDTKRLIGRKFNEPCVQADMKHWPFTVAQKFGSEKAVIIAPKIPGKITEEIHFPEYFAMKILEHLIQMAKKHLKGIPIKRVVITVPAYFNDGQREATKDAAEMVDPNLKVLRIVNEPTAAAIAYYLHKVDVGSGSLASNILVYDLGGGTFDVSVLKISRGEIEVLATGGDTHLGGADFDNKLIRHCVNKFKEEHGIDLELERGRKAMDEAIRTRTSRLLHRLRAECEKEKKALSTSYRTTIAIDRVAGDVDLSVLVTRKEFEEMNMPLFEKTIDLVKKALEDAQLSTDQIDEVVMVGGSSRIPQIQSMVRDFFDGKQLLTCLNPDEVVARGAAILAAKLNGIEEQKLQKMSLRDVNPLSIGIEVSDGSFHVIIPRNTRLPFRSEPETYTTANDNQTKVVITVFEGEDKTKATNNHLLGKFFLSNIPANVAGEERIDVMMKVNEDGILSVSASCLSSGSSNTITIRADKGRMNAEEKRRLRLGDS